MARLKDAQKQSTGIEQGLTPRMKAFKDELSQKFPNVRWTSGKREAKEKVGKNHRHSHHNTGDALDFGAEHEDVYNYLYNTTEGLSLLKKHGLGVINETDPETMKKTGATGAHYHIGPDSHYVEEVDKRFAEVSLSTQNSENNLIPFEVPNPETGEVELRYVDPKAFEKEIEKQKTKEKKAEEIEETPEQKKIREEQEKRQSFLQEATNLAAAPEYDMGDDSEGGIPISQIEMIQRRELQDLPNIFNTQRAELTSIQNPVIPEQPAEEQEFAKGGSQGYPPPNDNLYYGPGDSEYMLNQPLNMDIMDMYQNRNRLDFQDWLRTPNDFELKKSQYLKNLKRGQVGDIREASNKSTQGIKIII
jgi:hypothetical protein